MILHWRRISETNTLKVGKRAKTYSLISLIKFTKPFLKGTFPVENEQPPTGWHDNWQSLKSFSGGTGNQLKQYDAVRI